MQSQQTKHLSCTAVSSFYLLITHLQLTSMLTGAVSLAGQHHSSFAAPFQPGSFWKGAEAATHCHPPPASPCIRGWPGPCFPPQPEPKFLVFSTSYHSHLPLVTLYVASYFYCFNYTFSTAPTSQIHKQMCLRKKFTLLNRSLSCKLLYGFTALFLTQGHPPPNPSSCHTHIHK